MPNTRRIFKFETWISILALITGVAALLFSWQANQIAKQQITSEMAILDIVNVPPLIDVYLAAIDVDDRMVSSHGSCTQRIRLTNLGGAPASLIGYKAEVSFEDKRNILVSRKSTKIQGSELFAPVFNAFELVITNDDSTDEWTSLPVKIDAYETLDISTNLGFDYSFSLDESPVLKIAYIFEFSPKQHLVSPAINCIYLK
jgi:hypothetical protein